jgi:hypothetical protein
MPANTCRHAACFWKPRCGSAGAGGTATAPDGNVAPAGANWCRWMLRCISGYRVWLEIPAPHRYHPSGVRHVLQSRFSGCSLIPQSHARVLHVTLSCPVSIGELLDKISILRIKLARIKDQAKLAHVKTELDALTKLLGDMAPYESLLQEFAIHNSVIWDVEDTLRRKEKRGEYDAEFIEAARLAYLTNDRRFAVKNAANIRFNSAIREQKSHE